MFFDTRVASFGGGHGLFQTLRAVRQLSPHQITAIVTVADDGGSSGRIRRELGQIPPGDLRMALAALAPNDERGKLWEETLQHRFGGHGALAGHAVGNMLISGLYDVLGSEVAALDAVAEMIRAEGRVLPLADQPLDIEAEVQGLESDPRIMREVRGQVAVATTVGQVRRVRLIPDKPSACIEALCAVEQADVITLGPGSWFSSVLPHLLVPEMVEAINQSSALRIVILNLDAEPGETAGFSAERHLHIMRQHAQNFSADIVIADSSALGTQADRTHLERAAESIGAQLKFYDLREADYRGAYTSRHDPRKLAAALRQEYSDRAGEGEGTLHSRHS
ncbi:uridine diphosphate-N-acetylglucosamine-binding protein YvcK [Corynebacterium sp. ES2794-CONJ1]|uniref:gluconeogenesis factor YvcK family protein n=1 Tax=unclassified Corynebacterium TaxID=2624378 RepID=UPI0021677D43|nr:MULTISPECIES: uridine diphosphate-N-acetylglucosamine-binding protein YvcK [unclassified Corynebacterium]MCS4489282.1 uridine diphosphate-N-acetylglucosamine-binding protein YvcK [Corynebacterium sp. ES2775-CONJ]MCS4491095.1 uridine diphosphate-N-acetylglucosamine-binding protein YvcK [Corynebacterium sp. ES2715-CONJ3]MCS4531024.1 uridine diphosphate-N-acetylglucosamine-binding protein YvcK [Corynebacterium sp. ES2730-CONJ]MCU9518391.1 uridine diphosphate-N-acetylglucosamine-binding protein 